MTLKRDRAFPTAQLDRPGMSYRQYLVAKIAAGLTWAGVHKGDLGEIAEGVVSIADAIIREMARTAEEDSK